MPLTPWALKFWASLLLGGVSEWVGECWELVTYFCDLNGPFDDVFVDSDVCLFSRLGFLFVLILFLV